MFPTISDLLQYLTGWRLPLPFQTFGTMMALAFAGAYWAYGVELKRKEAAGQIKAIEKIAGSTGWPALAGYALLAGIVSAKLIPAIMHYRSFAAHPDRILFSRVGHWPVGLLTALLAAGLLYRTKRKKAAVVEKIMVHPYQLMPSLLWWCGLAGFAGAVVFHRLENATGEGFTYYGGLLCGIGVALYIAYRHKIPLVHMLDMGSPAMMLAYGIGRLGCHLSGDGDWGIVNTAPMPNWLSFLPSGCWAYQYPLSGQPVFPTSLYEGIACLLLFLLLWQLRHRFITPGKLFAVYCLLNGTERLLIEQIRVNPVYRAGFIRFTQAELIGSLFIVTGIIFLLATALKRNGRMNTVHAPAAVP
ncbi:prolipoprotein diacylglyceryl transferase [Longitalea luteola]|uniref:prolipoprotein diacylglyceryl transferase n=1 Tax=Longitalea luteola TaxID=2812563 RepID=UPI001A96DCD4|nr:prolipoprotein diacylglyceryl transferase family protein [Longitalea luteola]